MSSVKSTGSTYSVGPNGIAEGEAPLSDTEKKGEILKCGHLKKLKGSDGRNILLAQTMKRKYFVLRGETENSSASLEYYDSEKKCKAGHPPKRSIALKTCFNINRKVDKKQKHVIALYTKDDCFSMVFENEEELEDWLTALLSLQHGEDALEGETPKPTFEHVWQVVVKQKGLATSKNILGPYRLCLTSKALSLVKMSQDDAPSMVEFPLMSIRCCGHSDCFFFMELGRSAITGAGELWMQTEDTMIAQNMHEAILSAMRNSAKDEAPLRPRTWSTSTSNSEATKPIIVVARRQTTSSAMPPSLCKSLPSSTSSALCSRAPVLLSTARTSRRRHSVSAPPPRVYAHTPGATTNRDRADSMPSRSRTISEGHSHAHHGPVSQQPSLGSIRSGGGGSGQTAAPPLSSGVGASQHLQSAGVGSAAGLATASRPHSMYSRAISYSPPVPTASVRDTVCMSFSPSSVAYSTDSAGSSMSIDEVEMDSIHHGAVATPDSLPMEPAILEESLDEYVPWQGPNEVEEKESSSYMQMDRSTGSLSLLLNQSGSRNFKFSPGQGFTSGSPSQGSYMEMLSPCGTSPTDPSVGYIPMSPGAAPASAGGDSLLKAALYGKMSANHSRTSSLAEETPDGYVPMAPGGVDSGYAEMEPGRGQAGHHSLDEFQVGMSPGSSCSVTSGTPSTDLKFSEYHLEKVCSYFPPSEDEGVQVERPVRAYSVGSRPECAKRKNSTNRLEVAQENFRVRAFSLGSRLGMKLGNNSANSSGSSAKNSTSSDSSQPISKPPSSSSSESSQQGRVGKKCNSAPVLVASPPHPVASSWSGSGSYFRSFFGGNKDGGVVAASPPKDVKDPATSGSTDLMEMDFSKKRNSSASSLGAEIRERSGSKGGRVRSALARSFRVDSFRRKKSQPPPEDDDYIMMVGGHHHHGPPHVLENNSSPAGKQQPVADYMVMGKQPGRAEPTTAYVSMAPAAATQEPMTAYVSMVPAAATQASEAKSSLLLPPPWGSQQQGKSVEAVVPAGYVDMTCGKRKDSLVSSQPTPQLTSPESEEYMLLDVGAYHHSSSPAVTPTNPHISPSSAFSPGDYVSMMSGWKARDRGGSLKVSRASPRNIPTSQPISIQAGDRSGNNSNNNSHNNNNCEYMLSDELSLPPRSSSVSSKLPSPYGSLSGVLCTRKSGGATPPRGSPKSPSSSPFSSLRRKVLPSRGGAPVVVAAPPPLQADKLTKSLEALGMSLRPCSSPPVPGTTTTTTTSAAPQLHPTLTATCSTTSCTQTSEGRIGNTGDGKSGANSGASRGSSWSIGSGGSCDTSSSPSNTSVVSLTEALPQSAGAPSDTAAATHDYVNMAVLKSITRPKSSPHKPDPTPSEPVLLSTRLGLKSAAFTHKRPADATLDAPVATPSAFAPVSAASQVAHPTYENLNFGRAVAPDKELNYASLDLPADEKLGVKGQKGGDVGGGDPTPNVDDDGTTTPRQRLSYAQIDFTRSEGIRNTPHSLLRDPRH